MQYSRLAVGGAPSSRVQFRGSINRSEDSEQLLYPCNDNHVCMITMMYIIQITSLIMLHIDGDDDDDDLPLAL